MFLYTEKQAHTLATNIFGNFSVLVRGVVTGGGYIHIGIYTLQKSGQGNFLWSNNDVRTVTITELIPQ